MAWSVALFLVVSVALLVFVRRLPHALGLLVVLAALLNAAGGCFGWFDGVVWFDEVAHTFTPFAGLAAMGYLHAREQRHRRRTLIRWSVAMGLALGVGWEAIERLFGELALWDTVSDIALDGVGAALGGWFAQWALGAPTGVASPRPRGEPAATCRSDRV